MLDDLTLDLLVPDQYRDMEQEISSVWRDYFYFEKVEAENDHNGSAGREERLDITEDRLTVDIIYGKDGQRCFTYRSDRASADGSWITDPLIQIYTGNIHCNEIAPYILECGAQESLKGSRPLRDG